MSETFYCSSRIRTMMILIGMIVVFILPYGYHVDIGPGPSGFMAITWDLPQNGRINLFYPALKYFPYYIYRFVVLYAIWKQSLVKIKSKRVLLHALISELIPILFSIPGALFLNSEGENVIPIIVPLPFLLAYVILLISISRNGNVLNMRKT
jgi:hypothetical protein